MVKWRRYLTLSFICTNCNVIVPKMVSQHKEKMQLIIASGPVVLELVSFHYLLVLFWLSHLKRKGNENNHA